MSRQVVFSQIDQHARKIGVCFGVVGLDFQRVEKTLAGLVEAILLRIDATKSNPNGGISRRFRHGVRPNAHLRLINLVSFPGRNP